MRFQWSRDHLLDIYWLSINYANFLLSLLWIFIWEGPFYSLWVWRLAINRTVAGSSWDYCVLFLLVKSLVWINFFCCQVELSASSLFQISLVLFICPLFILIPRALRISRDIARSSVHIYSNILGVVLATCDAVVIHAALSVKVVIIWIKIVSHVINLLRFLIEFLY